MALKIGISLKGVGDRLKGILEESGDLALENFKRRLSQDVSIASERVEETARNLRSATQAQSVISGFKLGQFQTPIIIGGIILLILLLRRG